MANPRSGDGLAVGFLKDHPPVNCKPVHFEEMNQTVECVMRLYNVLEPQEREACLQQMSDSLLDKDKGVRRVVCIMGGDGSLATTINFFRTSEVIDAAL